MPIHRCLAHLVLRAEKECGLKNEAKSRFWNAVLDAAQSRLPEPFLLIGDFNTGVQRMDEVGRTFVCTEHFEKFSAPGWTDMALGCSIPSGGFCVAGA